MYSSLYWAVTLAVASPYQGVKLGPGLVSVIRVDSKDSLQANNREHRRWYIYPDFKTHPWVESTEVQNRGYQWLHKMVALSPQKFLKKNNNKTISCTNASNCFIEQKLLQLLLFAQQSMAK